MTINERLLENRLLQYTVAFPFSLLGAVICYFLGGKLATLSSNRFSSIGGSIEAGGAIVLFVVMFTLSTRWLGGGAADRSVEVRLSVTPMKGSPAFRSGHSYKAVYTITHGREDSPPESMTPRREGNRLIIDVPGVRVADKISATIQDEIEDMTWMVTPVKLTEPLCEASKLEPVPMSADAALQQTVASPPGSFEDVSSPQAPAEPLQAVARVQLGGLRTFDPQRPRTREPGRNESGATPAPNQEQESRATRQRDWRTG